MGGGKDRVAIPTTLLSQARTHARPTRRCCSVVLPRRGPGGGVAGRRCHVGPTPREVEPQRGHRPRATLHSWAREENSRTGHFAKSSHVFPRVHKGRRRREGAPPAPENGAAQGSTGPSANGKAPTRLRLDGPLLRSAGRDDRATEAQGKPGTAHPPIDWQVQVYPSDIRTPPSQQCSRGPV